MDVTKEIDLLKRYFKNKASDGALTLNGEDVLAAFARLVASLETLGSGTADSMAHNIEAHRDHYLWVRKHYIAARQEFDSKPSEKVTSRFCDGRRNSTAQKSASTTLTLWDKVNPGN